MTASSYECRRDALFAAALLLSSGQYARQVSGLGEDTLHYARQFERFLAEDDELDIEDDDDDRDAFGRNFIKEHTAQHQLQRETWAVPPGATEITVPTFSKNAIIAVIGPKPEYESVPFESVWGPESTTIRFGIWDLSSAPGGWRSWKAGPEGAKVTMMW